MAGNNKSRGTFDDYDGFVEKFKPKKTTDDCYTPQNIMDVVQDYVTEHYGFSREQMVRPFWPGGDYERFDYPTGCVVVDNPPFSIIASICREYQRRQQPFFLFCPYLTAGSISKVDGVTVIVTSKTIRYENGAEIASSFVTNLEPENIIRNDLELAQKIKDADAENRKAITKELPKYIYPDHVLTVTKVGWFNEHNTPYTLKRKDCCVISDMDEQRRIGKGIFGSGYLLCDRAAAERAAAERAAAECAAALKWQLSDRERMIVEMLNRQACK